MLYINKSEEIEQLRKMSLYLKADFVEGVDSAKLEFDNEFGKGKISIFIVFPGLLAKSYDINLTKELKFSKREVDTNPIYFIYCVKGHYYHGFENEENLDKIACNQNVILTSSTEVDHKILMPPEIHIKFSAIFLDKKKMETGSEVSKWKLDNYIGSVFEIIDTKPQSKYLGKINLVTSKFAELLIDNDRVDIVGKLISEGALFNTLGSQLQSYRDHNSTDYEDTNVLNHDLEKLVKLGDYIEKHLSDDLRVEVLVKISGLNKKKLQAGCQYLYGESVNRFIQRLRLEKARMLFQTTELSVSEICYEVGLNSRSYFSKIFKEAFGFFPSEYKATINNEDHIFELSYYSEAIPEIKENDLKDILDSSLKNNERNKITGALVYHENRFFQIIEGPKSKVLDLYNILLKDERHKHIKLIWKGVRMRRTFKDWAMAFIADDRITGIKKDGVPSYMNIENLLKKLDDKELFADILWRRVLNILKEVA